MAVENPFAAGIGTSKQGYNGSRGVSGPALPDPPILDQACSRALTCQTDDSDAPWPSPTRKAVPMKPLLRLPASLLALSVLAGCSGGATTASTPSPSPSASTVTGFIGRQGMNLMLNGSPYHFVGYDEAMDAEYFPGLACMTGPSTDAQLEQEFSRFQDLGVGIVRVFFFQSMALNNGKLDFSGLDRCISHARAHGVRLIVCLTQGDINSAKNDTPCELPGALLRNLAWYSQQSGEAAPGYKTVESGYLYSYRDYCSQIAAHYASEPDIAWWELVNEPADVTTPTSVQENLAAPALRAFADDMVGVMKAADSNHLVSLGTTGKANSAGTMSGSYASQSYAASAGTPGISNDFMYAQAGAVDLVSIHEYSSQYTGSDLIGFYNGISPELQAHLQEAQALDKPLYIGETGLINDGTVQSVCSNAHENYAGSNVTDRPSCFDAKFHAFFSSSIPVAGALIWQATGGESGIDADCFSVGHVGSETGAIDPVDAIVAKHAGGKP